MTGRHNNIIKMGDRGEPQILSMKMKTFDDDFVKNELHNDDNKPVVVTSSSDVVLRSGETPELEVTYRTLTARVWYLQHPEFVFEGPTFAHDGEAASISGTTVYLWPFGRAVTF